MLLLTRLVVSVSALASLAPAPQTTAPFDPIQAFAPKSLKLDDRLKKGVEWKKPLPCGANHATVTVRFDKVYLGESDLYLPVAKVSLHAGKPGDASEQWAAAVLKAPTDTWKLNGLAWLEKITTSKSEGPGGYGLADLSRPIKLELTWTAEGVVRVDFGGEFVKQITLDKPINSIGINGSFVRSEFIDLKVGRVGAPDPACDKGGIETPPIVIHPSDSARVEK